jgi:hypothetical protein
MTNLTNIRLYCTSFSFCFSSTFINSSCRGHPVQLGSRGSQIEQLDSRGNIYEQLYDSRGQLFEQLGSRSGQFEQLCSSSSFQFEQLGSWSNQAAAGGQSGTLDRRQAAVPVQRKLSGVHGSTGGLYGSTGGGHGSFGDMMRSTGGVHGSAVGVHGSTGGMPGSTSGMPGSTGGPPRNSASVFDGAECFPRQKSLSSGQRSAGKGAAEQTECRTQPTITLRRKGIELKYAWII